MSTYPKVRPRTALEEAWFQADKYRTRYRLALLWLFVLALYILS
jgi:hypothetical protein